MKIKNQSAILFGMSIALLTGCGSMIESEELKLSSNQQYSPMQLSMESQEVLTVQTVEFSSKESVAKLGVALFDFETKQEIERGIVDQNGMVHFEQVFPEVLYDIVIYRITDHGEWMEQSRESIVFNPSKPIIQIETFNVSPKDSLKVPVVLQNPELPNGCEITSLTAILNYYGIKMDKLQMNEYLPKSKVYKKNGVTYGPDPNKAYAGDPKEKDGGYYVYAPPLVDVANKVLAENNLEFRALDLTNATKQELIDYVKSGVPVLTWVTIDWKEPRKFSHWVIEGTNQKHGVYKNLHAVVLTGYQNGKVTIMNPLTGIEKIDEKTFFRTYKQLGSHALVIL
ncbi:C39 family peptidase [Ureibacillus sp. FSL K6-2830]|uniref:C39 family peptidase n=1 Tax=Ureibacillus sp. FSL K6-2830 TaxID=2954610 RepID=UPI0030F4D942